MNVEVFNLLALLLLLTFLLVFPSQLIKMSVTILSILYSKCRKFHDMTNAISTRVVKWVCIGPDNRKGTTCVKQ